MKKLRSNKCNVAVRLMLIFILILIIILGVFLYFRYYGDFAEEDAKTEPEKIFPPTEEQMYYEQIKRDIATGKLDEVPEGIDKSKRLVIREYLYDCYMMDDMDEKLKCYEDHYFNVDPELRQQKNNCEQMQGNEKTECLDQLYFKVASDEQYLFCNRIIDSNLKEECLKRE